MLSLWNVLFRLVLVVLAGVIVAGRVRRKCADAVAVTLNVQPQAHCRDEFRATGTVNVAYPAGRPALTTVVLSHSHQLAPSTNLTGVTISPSTLTFRRAGQQVFTVAGDLRNPCLDGQLSIFATATCGSSDPSDINLARITQAAPGAVAAKPIDLVTPLPQGIASTPDFSVDFAFTCCGAAAVTVDITPLRNIAITSPNPEVVACAAGQQKTVTIKGTRPDATAAGQFRVTATVGGVACTVGVVDVE